jgi:hypothetical protein
MMLQQKRTNFLNQTSLQYSFTRTVIQHNHYCTDTNTTECKQTEEDSVLQTEALSM